MIFQSPIPGYLKIKFKVKGLSFMLPMAARSLNLVKFRLRDRLPQPGFGEIQAASLKFRLRA